MLLAAYVPSVALLILVVSLWAIATGILEVIAAVFVRRIAALSWGIALVGVASCAAGIVMLDWRNLAEIGLLYAFAAYALIAGILLRHARHRARARVPPRARLSARALPHRHRAGEQRGQLFFSDPARRVREQPLLRVRAGDERAGRPPSP